MSEKPRKDNDHRDHWLVRPGSIRLLWIVFVLVLAATVLLQFTVKIDSHFRIDGWMAFAAVFGFISCAAMVFGARLLGMILKRRDDYYDV